MMNTRYYRRSISRAHQECTDTERDSDKPLCTHEYPGLELCEYGTDYSHRKEARYKYSYKRRYEQVDHLGNVLMQPVLELTHEPYRDDDRDNMSLITCILNIPKSEPRPQGRSLRTGCHRPCVDKARVDHDHSYNSTEIDITSEDLRSTYCDKDRQECQSRIREHIKKCVDIMIRDRRECSRKTSEQAVKKTRGDDRRDDRYEYIT